MGSDQTSLLVVIGLIIATPVVIGLVIFLADRYFARRKSNQILTQLNKQEGNNYDFVVVGRRKFTKGQVTLVVLLILLGLVWEWFLLAGIAAAFYFWDRRLAAGSADSIDMYELHFSSAPGQKVASIAAAEWNPSRRSMGSWVQVFRDEVFLYEGKAKSSVSSQA